MNNFDKPWMRFCKRAELIFHAGILLQPQLLEHTDDWVLQVRFDVQILLWSLLQGYHLWFQHHMALIGRMIGLGRFRSDLLLACTTVPLSL
jgi:hypothetical protein